MKPGQYVFFKQGDHWASRPEPYDEKFFEDNYFHSAVIAKPCPFCGRTDYLAINEKLLTIECENCKMVYYSWAEEIDYIIDGWNSRPEEE